MVKIEELRLRVLFPFIATEPSGSGPGLQRLLESLLTAEIETRSGSVPLWEEANVVSEHYRQELFSPIEDFLFSVGGTGIGRRLALNPAVKNKILGQGGRMYVDNLPTVTDSDEQPSKPLSVVADELELFINATGPCLLSFNLLLHVADNPDLPAASIQNFVYHTLQRKFRRREIREAWFRIAENEGQSVEAPAEVVMDQSSGRLYLAESAPIRKIEKGEMRDKKTELVNDDAEEVRSALRRWIGVPGQCFPIEHLKEVALEPLLRDDTLRVDDIRLATFGCHSVVRFSEQTEFTECSPERDEWLPLLFGMAQAQEAGHSGDPKSRVASIAHELLDRKHIFAVGSNSAVHFTSWQCDGTDGKPSDFDMNKVEHYHTKYFVPTLLGNIRRMFHRKVHRELTALLAVSSQESATLDSAILREETMVVNSIAGGKRISHRDVVNLTYACVRDAYELDDGRTTVSTALENLHQELQLHETHEIHRKTETLEAFFAGAYSIYLTYYVGKLSHFPEWWIRAGVIGGALFSVLVAGGILRIPWGRCTRKWKLVARIFEERADVVSVRVKRGLAVGIAALAVYIGIGYWLNNGEDHDNDGAQVNAEKLNDSEKGSKDSGVPGKPGESETIHSPEKPKR